MKSIHYIRLLGLLFLTEACAQKTEEQTVTQATAAQPAIGRYIQQMMKGVTYTPLAWRKTTPLYSQDAGEVAIQEQFGLWVAEKKHAATYDDSLAREYQEQLFASKGYRRKTELDTAALRPASRSATAAEHRARKRELLLTRLLDSVQQATDVQAPPVQAPATSTIIGQRGWHLFQVTDAHGQQHRDSVEYIILPSGKAFICFDRETIAARPWQPDLRYDPY